MEENDLSLKLVVLKNFYFYLVSFAALMMIVFSGISIVSDILKLTVFPKADNFYGGYVAPGCDGSYTTPGQPTTTPEMCEIQKDKYKKEQEEYRVARIQQSLVWSISVFVIGIPLFIFHWRAISRNKKKTV